MKELPPIENTLSSKGSLSDHLMWQLNLQQSETDVRDIGAAIIGNLDEDGYLVASVNEIATLGGWDVTAVERALEFVQSFDPVGVAARDLQECLLIQIRHLGLAGTPVEVLVRDHLRLLQNHKFPELARALGIEPEEVKQHIEVIKRLDPKPGSRYSPADSQYVIPDVYVIKTDDGYRAVLNEDGLPQLRISPVYRRLLDKGGEVSDETRAYVKDKFRAALWLLKSVDQRQKTIVKVATSLINFQRAFLDQGIEHLRPLVLRDVANDIGMHESTVSRVVNNKYMHTPQGVYELKFFFHSGISSSYGENVSSVTIKERIRKIVERRGPEAAAQRLEDHEHPSEGRSGARAPDHREVSRGAADSRPRTSGKWCTEPSVAAASLHRARKTRVSPERRARPRGRPRASAAFVVVTGLSGSGKSHAIRALEDLGYFCVDNLPVALIPTFADLTLRAPGGVRRAAVVVDVREGRALASFPAAYRRLKKNAGSHQVRLVFLDAGHSTLLRRFSETRRPHPLALNRTVAEGLLEERRLLEPIRRIADQVLDTSALTVHELRRRILETVGGTERVAPLGVTLLSFGFRHGVPENADLVFDVRFLPNPHFVRSLRRWSGRHARVAEYVLRTRSGPAIRAADDRLSEVSRAAVHRGREDLSHDRGGVHRRPAPVGGDCRRARQTPPAAVRCGRPRPPSRRRSECEVELESPSLTLRS